MKKSVILGIILLLAAVSSYAQFERQKAYLNLSAGYGLSSSAYTSTDAGIFGSTYWGDSTLFVNNDGFDPDFAKRVLVSLDYFFTDRVAANFGFGYSNRPFTHVYLKNTAANDYVITANYEFIEFVGGIKSILFKSLYLGVGISYNHVLSSSSYEILGNSAIISPLELAEDNMSAYLDIGSGFRLANSNIMYVYLKYQNDIDPVFPFIYDVSELSLIDLTLNMAISMPL